MEQNETVVDEEVGISHSKLLSFEETRCQMAAGFENTQRVVQFMDTKAAAIVGLCLGIFYVVGQVVLTLHERLGEGMLSLESQNYQPILWLFAGLIVSVGVVGFLCLYYAFKTVRPNSLPKAEHFTTLFPVVDQPWNDKHAIEHLTKVVTGDHRVLVLNEYKQQLLAMGGLVYSKIKFLRKAINMLGLQGACTCILLLLTGITFGFGLLKQKEDVTRDQKVEVVGDPNPLPTRR